MEMGMALGIVFIRYQNHEEAKQCIEKANGKKLRVVGASESEELRAVFDGQGGRLKAMLKELDDRKKREQEEKRRKDKEDTAPQIASMSTPNSSQTPASNSNRRPNHALPPRPAYIPLSTGRSFPVLKPINCRPRQYLRCVRIILFMNSFTIFMSWPRPPILNIADPTWKVLDADALRRIPLDTIALTSMRCTSKPARRRVQLA